VNSSRVIAVAAALAACAAAAGCGSDSNSSSTAASGQSASGGGPPIKLMIIDALDSPLPVGIAPEAAAAARAKVNAINAAGGIKGRKLELTVCNDQADTNKAAACARQAVSSGVVAIVGSPGPETAAAYPILEQAGIASIGPTPTTPAIGNSPVSTCFTTAVAGEFVAMPTLLKQQGSQVHSVIYPGDYGAASTLLKTTFTLGVKKAGSKLGALSTYAASQTQFGASVAKALGNGTDGVAAFAPGATQGPLMASIISQNPKVKIVMPASSFLPSVAKYLGDKINGIYVVGEGMPATSKAQGIAMFNADMDKHEPKATRNDLAIDAWTSVWVFQKLAEKAKTIDRPSILQATKAIRGLDVGGIYPPLDRSTPFTGLPGDTCVANPTVVLQVVKDGKLVPIEDGKFTNPFE
jgi:branched-chain amino acid transport system substrate-binding protein